MRLDAISESRLGKIVGRLPAHSSWVKLLKAGGKSAILARRPFGGRQVVFEGIGDAVVGKFYSPGPGRDEVLIETIFSAVSPGTEKGYYLDLPNFHQPRPYVPGYSGCGRVKAAGRNSVFQKGDLVAGGLKHSSRQLAAADSLARVPPGVEIGGAAFVSLGVIAFTGVRRAVIAGGERVGVLGQGILGQMINRMARLEGAGRVSALALGDSKKEMAEESGVDEFIALRDYGRPLSSLGYDVVIDSTGSLKGFESALEMVRPGGRVVMLGSIAGYAEESDWARVALEKGLEIRGAHVRNLRAEGLTYREEAVRFLGLLAEKKLKINHLITDIYRPAQAPEIYRRLAAGDRNLVGTLIDWRPGGDS